MNRADRRKATYLDHPAYIWAIESDWPQKDAKLLVYCIQYNFSNAHLEGKMGARLMFTKFNNVLVHDVTDKGIHVRFDIDRLDFVWIARSNIRSDDDRRMGEIRHQLESQDYIKTSIHIVDWLVAKEGWKP